MKTIPLKQLMEKMEQDPIFSFLYPACAAYGANPDDFVKLVRETAGLTGADIMDIACTFRAWLVRSNITQS